MSAAAQWTELFGSKLLKGTEEVDTLEALSNKKCIAIYFSAHWCPPCRGFTPKLAEWYKADLSAKGIEVVFASSDRDEAAFKEYYAEMPWLALPFAERELKAKLGEKCKCQGIPHLALFKPDGQLITLEGRSKVSQDPTCADFPWPEKSISDLLGPLTFEKKGSKINLADLKGKKIGIYFSAHWCPPCRNFTPKLAEVYKKIAEDKNWEVIFVSSDRDEKSFNEYYETMPWACLPFSERDAKGKLSEKFGVQGIPTLVMLDENLEILTDGAVGPVHGDAEGKNFPWNSSSAFADLDEDPEGIDEMPALTVIHNLVDATEQEANKAVLKTLGEESKAAAAARKEANKGKAVSIFEDSAEDESMAFFHASQTGGRLRDRVADECKLKKDEKKTQVVLLCIHKSGGYYSFPADKAFTLETAKDFLADFKAGKLTRKQMGADDE